MQYLESFERIITRILLVMMAVVVLLATVEVIWFIIVDVLTPPVLVLEVWELLDLFGLFLLVLIGLELLHSVKIYIEQREIHVESVPPWCLRSFSAITSYGAVTGKTAAPIAKAWNNEDANPEKQAR
jgi:hypothetical protein